MSTDAAHSSGQPRWVRPILITIVALYVVLGASFAALTPAWQAPDEPAHYNLVAQVAVAGCCPLIEPGDWDASYLAILTDERFAPSLLSDLPAIQYEDHQPPLYYLLMAPIFTLSDGNLIALRTASMLLGVLVVLAAFAVTQRSMPGRPAVALGAAAFVAFIPQHVHMLASVNNDALAWALVGWILYASIDHAAGGKTPAWAVGLLVGLALLTKTTAYLMAGVALIAVILRAWDSGWNGRIRSVTLYLVPALGLGLLWWLRNIGVYGFPDFLGLRAHDMVVVGQLRTADYLAEVGAAQYLRAAVQTTVTSFFGQFGWMAVPLPTWALTVFGGVTLLGIAGSAIWRALRPSARFAWPLLDLTSVLAVAVLIYYNTQFVQFQGRYAYPLLIPLGAAVAAGLDAWRKRIPVVRDWPWLMPLALCGLVVLDFWLLTRVLVPNLTP